MIRDKDWVILHDAFNAEVRFEICGVEGKGCSIGDALKSESPRRHGREIVAYAVFEKRRDEKGEYEYAKEQVKERRLQEAIDDWEADWGHPDMFSKKLTPMYDGSRPTIDDIAEPSDTDVADEVYELSQLDWDDRWREFGKAKTAQQALDAMCISVDDIEVLGFKCDQCSEKFDWHCGRFCDHCHEPMCPTCHEHADIVDAVENLAELSYCGHCDQHVPWKPDERITLAMQRRGKRVVDQQRRALGHNKIDAKIEFSETRMEAECMDGS